ncbi:hypothetical protein ELQ35_10225 [Peribacillus cavernae]|uniref:MBL fold metallo-hydrolase n=1 Tax=Peribacillus cavernae TaxID=1674310 RepID=A0A433HM93_9BACI|nr:hypothetical protein [Peribacillus cavernae]MDQ0218959.1 D-ribose pyranose/furanose isomerase RbsD [Peribacillus cavernae]RUQ29333.1 hypothetical protein ELQ35_10225 [Peribacillus cavernae]
MKLIFSIIIALSGWLPNIDDESVIPDEIEKIDLNLMENEYAFTFFDLSSGDAAILQAEDGSTILINTGTAAEENKLKKWLTLYGVKKIDAVILTKATKGYDDNVKNIVTEYNVPRVIAGKKMENRVNSILSDLQGVELSLWSEQSKETFLDEIEISVIHENDTKEEGLDLSFKIKDNYLLYVTSSSEKIRNKLMELNPSDVQIIKAPYNAMPFATAEHLDPQAVILSEQVDKAVEREMVQKFREMWIEVFNTAKQGTVTAKFTKTTHEIFPIKNFLNTRK